ncbi:hypothetical protein V6N13_064602 [Hibiscus sabdariffa]|uniref:Uncharacterized protein n=1 Tax=Hibiscus sabdariffa TaxID=183260 RepID=A0ABR2EAJ9_9ROSI
MSNTPNSMVFPLVPLDHSSSLQSQIQTQLRNLTRTQLQELEQVKRQRRREDFIVRTLFNHEFHGPTLSVKRRSPEDDGRRLWVHEFQAIYGAEHERGGIRGGIREPEGGALGV